MKVATTPISQFAFKGIFQGLQKTDKTIKVEYTQDNSDEYVFNREIKFAKVDYPVSRAIYRPYSWETPRDYPAFKILPIKIEDSDGKFLNPKEYKAEVAIGKRLGREESLKLSHKEEVAEAKKLEEEIKESNEQARIHKERYIEQTRNRYLIIRPRITTNATSENSMQYAYEKRAKALEASLQETKKKIEAKDKEMKLIAEAKKNNDLTDISTCKNIQELGALGELIYKNRQQTKWLTSKVICLPNETLPLIDAVLIALDGEYRKKIAELPLETKRKLLREHQEEAGYTSRILYGLEGMLHPKGEVRQPINTDNMNRY